VNLDRAGPEDAERLAEAHAAAFEAPWPAGDLRALLESEGVFALTAATAEGPLAGFILCRALAGEAEILTLAVAPGHRRQGLGVGLVETAARLSAQTANALFLEVAADNPGAVALYRKAGFSPVGRRPGYYARPGGGTADAIVMRRDLNT